MLILPYRLTIAFLKAPVVNWVIIALTILAYCVQAFGGDAAHVLDGLVLREWDFIQFIGSLFLHGGITHLAGNMVFLWVFGNAICSTVGNRVYPFLYLLLGVSASIVHLAFDGAPSIGASGAIAGVMGMSLILFPVADLDIAYVVFIPLFGLLRAGTFPIKCFWLMILWFVMNLLMGLFGGGSVAYWAHVGGFVAGLVAAGVIIKLGRTQVFEPTIVDVIKGRADAELLSADSRSEEHMPDLELPAPVGPETQDEQRDILKKHDEDIHDLWTRGQQGVDPSADAGDVPRPVETADRGAAHTAAGEVPAPATSRVPKFRILKNIRSGDSVTCYFVNEGDQVGDLHVDAGDGLRAEIHPDRVLKKGEPGWIKVTGPNTGEAFTLSLTFGDGGAERGKMQFEVPAGA
jgi:membrane associated rhomboid family serine protease